MSNEKIVKVFHAARQDIEIFYALTKTVPAPLFDTQVAAMVCGYGDQVGYERLVQAVCGQALDKSSQFTNWSLRPLSDKQLKYALNDVLYLVDIYESLSKQLETTCRAHWVKEEMEILNDPAIYFTNPDNAWERIKIRKANPKTLNVLKYLAAWRERLALDKNIPRTWIVKDDTLTDLAFQKPKDEKGLSKIRGLNKAYMSGHKAQNILSVISDACAQPADTYPQKDDKKSLPSSYQATYDMLKFLLNLNAHENHVAPKLIADKTMLQDLARGKTEGNPILKGWRFDVFGHDAQALMKGDLSLSLKNGALFKEGA